jgi:hypothetical protein
MNKLNKKLSQGSMLTTGILIVCLSNVSRSTYCSPHNDDNEGDHKGLASVPGGSDGIILKWILNKHNLRVTVVSKN